MTEVGSNNVCTNSDFDTRGSGKKICFDNGMTFEVTNYDTLRVATPKSGTYNLWIWSHHVDSTGTKLWSVRATPLTLSIYY